MEVSELRIGNLIKRNGDGYDQSYVKWEIVKEIRKYPKSEGFKINDYSQEFYEPIPISKWALQAIGFKKSEDGIWQGDVLQLGIILYQEGDGMYISQGEETPHQLPHIKYIHQVQNLHFMLTGDGSVKFDIQDFTPDLP